MKKNYYELFYFYGRKDTGSIYIETELNLDDHVDEDEFLQRLVDRNELDFTVVNNITEINEIDKETYMNFNYN